MQQLPPEKFQTANTVDLDMLLYVCFWIVFLHLVFTTTPGRLLPTPQCACFQSDKDSSYPLLSICERPLPPNLRALSYRFHPLYSAWSCVLVPHTLLCPWWWLSHLLQITTIVTGEKQTNKKNLFIPGSSSFWGQFFPLASAVLLECDWYSHMLSLGMKAFSSML